MSNAHHITSPTLAAVWEVYFPIQGGHFSLAKSTRFIKTFEQGLESLDKRLRMRIRCPPCQGLAAPGPRSLVFGRRTQYCRIGLTAQCGNTECDRPVDERQGWLRAPPGPPRQGASPLHSLSIHSHFQICLLTREEEHADGAQC